MRARIKTGVVGLDKMLYGGVPEGNQVIVAGGPGSGKTLLCFEFLYKNAKDGDVCLLFSLEEDTQSIIDNAKEAYAEFTDIDDLIKNKKLIICGSDKTSRFVHRDIEGNAYTFGKMVSEIEALILDSGAKRIVIDSVSVIKLFIKDLYEYRNISVGLISVLRNLKTTCLLTMEIEAAERSRLVFQPEFFIYDGIIMMYTTGGESESRAPTMEIIKMRGTGHSFSPVPYEITPSGINLMLLAERKEL